MRLLVIGGNGLVGSMVVPRLAESHEVRVLDLAAPATPLPAVEYHEGDLHDVPLVARLASEVDSLVFMAMGPVKDWGSPESAHQHFDVAVTGLYLVLMGAHQAGVAHVVFTSSMSVYRYPLQGDDFPKDGDRVTDADQLFTYPDESVPPDAGDFYGLAKRLGEEVCRNATVEWGMDAVCLRLCFPTPDDQWPRQGTVMQRIIATSARDIAAAIEAALHYRGKGFEPFAISGDGAERTMSLAKARRELGWHPQDSSATGPP